MNISFKIAFLKYIPVLSFWLFFPGFFLYQILINLSIIPAFLGGYFGSVSAVLLPLLVVVFLTNFLRKPRLIGVLDSLFLVLMLLIVIVTLGNYLLGEMAGNYELLYWNLSGVIFNLACYLMAKLFDLEEAKGRVLLPVSFVLVSVLFFLNLRNDAFSLLDSGIKGAATYQGYGRSIVAISLILVAGYRQALVRAALISVTSIILLLVGSRSDLLLYIGTVAAAYYYITAGSAPRIFLSIVTSLLIISILLTNVELILPSLKNTRLFDFVENGIFGSSSGQARLELAAAGWANIIDNPVLGRYGAYVKETGSIGSYPHNLLSAWLNLGIIGFFCYVLLIGALLYKSLRLVRIEINSLTLSSLFFTIFVIAAFITSKDYLFMFLGLSAGFTQSIYRRRVS